MKLVICFAAICIVGINGFSLGDDSHQSRGMFHEALADSACVSARLLQQAGWLNRDGTMSRQYMESESAKDCRAIAGRNPCDTADRMLSCLRNKGLATAINIASLPVGGGLSPF